MTVRSAESSKDRFVTLTNNEKESLLDTAMPYNTRKRNQWAMKILTTWRDWQKTTWAEHGGACRPI